MTRAKVSRLHLRRGHSLAGNPRRARRRECRGVQPAPARFVCFLLGCLAFLGLLSDGRGSRLML